MHIQHIFHFEKMDRKKKILAFLFVSAPVRVGGSTAPDTLVQVGETSCGYSKHKI